MARIASPSDAFALCFPVGFLDHAVTGDPIFLADSLSGEQSVSWYGRVSFTDTQSVRWVLTHWGSPLGAASAQDLCRLYPTLPPLTLETVVHVVMLNFLKVVFPPLPLASLEIKVPDAATYQTCDPYEVLQILRSLPPAAQTDWTRRVVARDNEIGAQCPWPPPDIADPLS
jgi:hypothetical protein